MDDRKMTCHPTCRFHVPKKEINYSKNSHHDKNDCRGRGLVVLAASFLLNFIADGVAYAFGIFVTKIVKDFPAAGMSGVAWIACIMTTMTHVGGPIGSMLINKFGWRVVSILGSLLAGGGFAVSYFAPNIPTMVATIGVAGGFGFTLIYLPSMVSLPEYFTSRRSLAVGVAVSGSGIGTFFFSWAFGLILSLYTWRQALLITGGIIFAATFFAFAYPATKSRQPQQKQQLCVVDGSKIDQNDQNIGSPNDPELGHDPSNFREPLSRETKLIDLTLFRDVPLVIFLIADLLTTMGYHVPFVYLPAIEETMMKGGSNSNSLLIVMSGAGVAGRILIGLISDKKWIPRLYVYTVCLMGAGIVTASSHHIESTVWLKVVWALYGLCMGLTSLKTVILVDLIGLKKLTDALGLCLLFEAAGFLMGAPIVGFFYDNFGTYSYGFYFVAAMFGLSALMVGTIPWFQQRQFQDKIGVSSPGHHHLESQIKIASGQTEKREKEEVGKNVSKIEKNQDGVLISASIIPLTVIPMGHAVII